MTRRIVLLLGVSGAGKSTLIDEIVRIDGRFLSVPAYTTRPARCDDRYRICISSSEFNVIEHTEPLLAANEICGYRYGTSKRMLLSVQEQHRVPILDYPLSKLGDIEREFPGQLWRVYVEPPSYEILWSRLQDGRDPDGQRFRAACKEIASVKRGEYVHHLDRRIVNAEGLLSRNAELICHEFWADSEEVWPDPANCKLKNDRYRHSRGGKAALIEILCSRCCHKVVLYQKDGQGGLYRLYLNRIVAPAKYSTLQSDGNVRKTRDMPHLVCSRCHNLIGVPMLHHEGRLAFRLVPASFFKKQVRH